MALRFPAYGKRLWHRRLLGERVRLAALLVGNFWRRPKWLPDDVPHVAVKTSLWHLPAQAERFDWRVLTACDVLAIDVRDPDEREEGPEGWDAWLWLLAAVQRCARSVVMLTHAHTFNDPPDPLMGYAPERWLTVYAWCGRTWDAEAREFSWPPWWPYDDWLPEAGR